MVDRQKDGNLLFNLFKARFSCFWCVRDTGAGIV
nr:MAG TPA: hypothetical protein [Caudoviricetes sp.]